MLFEEALFDATLNQKLEATKNLNNFKLTFILLYAHPTNGIQNL